MCRNIGAHFRIWNQYKVRLQPDGGFFPHHSVSFTPYFEARTHARTHAMELPDTCGSKQGFLSQLLSTLFSLVHSLWTHYKATGLFCTPLPHSLTLVTFTLQLDSLLRAPSTKLQCYEQSLQCVFFFTPQLAEWFQYSYWQLWILSLKRQLT